MKKLFLILLLGIVQVSFSQEEKKQFIHRGLLRATGTISPGYLFKDQAKTISLHGNLEYYVADNVSLRGDIFYDLLSNLGAGTEGRQLQFNHSLLSGASYHFKTSNHFDPYLGLQPGLALTKRIDKSGDEWGFVPLPPVPDYYYIIPQPQISPVISPLVGFNFYFQNWFHLFMETRYVHGKHLDTDGAPPISLSELRFSFGLGFNLSVFKQKNTSAASN